MPKYLILVTTLVYGLVSSLSLGAENLYTQEQIQKSLASPAFQSHQKNIDSLLGERNASGLVEYIGKLKKDASLNSLAKERLLENSISAISVLPRHSDSKNILEELSAYKTLSKIEFSDGPHQTQVNASSVAALAKLALKQWHIQDLSHTLTQALANRQYQAFYKTVSSDDNWLPAVEHAIEVTSEQSAVELFQFLQQKSAVFSQDAYLSYLAAKRIRNMQFMTLSLIALANNSDSQAYALQQLRKLNVNQHLDVYTAVARQGYLSSFALSQIGNVAGSSELAFDFLFEQLNDPSTGGKAAFALRQANAEQLVAKVLSELNQKTDALYQKRLLLSLKLHPETQELLTGIIQSPAVSASVKSELAAWLK